MRIARTMVLVAGAVLLMGAQAATGRKLQGTWCLDTSKSVFTGGMVDYRSTLNQCLKVDVIDDRVTVVTTTWGIGSSLVRQSLTTEQSEQHDGIATTFGIDGSAMAQFTRQISTTERYDIDGQTRSFPWGDTQETMTRSATWLPNMNGFDLTEIVSNGTPRVQHWTLSADGQTLTIDYVSSTSLEPQSNHRVLVYVKKA